MSEMTVLSKASLENALKISNPREAAAALLNYKHFRTLGDVIRSFCDAPDLKNTLVDGLLKWSPESKREAVDRKVRNWLAGRNQNVAKKDMFILAHTMKLTLERTNEFLKMAVGEGIHWRDPEDMAWSYAVIHQLSPERTGQLLERVNQAVGSADGSKPDAAAGSTMEVYEKLQPALFGSEDDLVLFVAAERERLGTFHNTAHRIFVRYMTLLEDGFSDEDVEALFDEMSQKERRQKEAEAADRRKTAQQKAEKEGAAIAERFDDDGDTEMYRPDGLTARDVLETYLYRTLVPSKEDKNAKKTDAFFAIRHSIRQNWPDEFTLSRMKNRQIDVSRKALILLFLATDGSNSDYESFDDEEEYTQEEAFEDIYTRLNLMLTSCGFAKLDPRSAFDWMVLFCISSGDLWESDGRIRNMLIEMFSHETA